MNKSTRYGISAPSHLSGGISAPSHLSGVRGHRQVFSGVRVTSTAGSEVVWRNQPRVRSSISRYALEAGSARLARKMDTYITSNMAELPKMLERRDTGEPMHVSTGTYLQIRALIRLVAAATIRERHLFRSALAQVRLLFESGVYSRVASIRSYTVYIVPSRDIVSFGSAGSLSRSAYQLVSSLHAP